MFPHFHQDVIIEFFIVDFQANTSTLGWKVPNFSHHIEVNHRGKQVNTSPIAITACLQPVC
jgi:hypothetical protein